MFTWDRGRVTSVLLTVVMVLALTPGIAVGSPNDPPQGTSTTNPSYPTAAFPSDLALPKPDDSSPYDLSWWRRSWGNSTSPQFFFDHPDSSTAAGVQGFYYVIDRSADTTLNLADIGSYYQSINPENTTVAKGIFNIQDVYSGDAPSGGWVYPSTGLRYPWEGQWYLHMMWYDTLPVTYATHHLRVGVDVTPPLPPSKVTVRPSVSYTGATDIWFSSRRAHVTWEDKTYDALSGTAKYAVYVDGKYVGPKYQGSHIFQSVTLEDLPGGEHTIAVSAIDRAGNASPKATAIFRTDPDVPTVKITSPSAGGVVGLSATFKATAADEGGVRYVDFAIDGKSVYTDTKAPYEFTKNMSAYSGGGHSVTATVKDMYGRTATATNKFTLDKVAPTVSSVNDTPDPFYPVLDDGYKDTMSVGFWCNEGGTAVLSVYDATGQLYAQRTKTVGSGWQSIVWDGVSKYDRIGVGTFRYTLSVKDIAGNTTSKGYFTTTINDYELVRIAPNAVKVVPR